MIQIRYENVATGAKENSTNTMSDINAISDITLLNESIIPTQYGTLERNYLVLDGKYEFRKNNSLIPYISNSLSDDNGEFSSDIILTRIYDNNYSAPRNYIYV